MLGDLQEDASTEILGRVAIVVVVVSAVRCAHIEQRLSRQLFWMTWGRAGWDSMKHQSQGRAVSVYRKVHVLTWVECIGFDNKLMLCDLFSRLLWCYEYNDDHDVTRLLHVGDGFVVATHCFDRKVHSCVYCV